LYINSLESYKKVLENYKQLSKELNINSSLDLSHLFTYMLWNGYFSVTKQHSYKLEERLLLPGMHSFDVIKGKGVCLAYAQLLSDFLAMCEKNSALLNVKVPSGKNKIKSDYRPEIERNVQISKASLIKSKMLALFLKGLINKVGNHAITLIEEDNKIFAYDPTNLFVLNVKDDEVAKIINGEGTFDIKLLASLMLFPHSDINNIYEKLLSGNIEPAFTRKEIVLSFEEIMELLNSNINLLNDVYDNIHPELEIINKQTDDIGGYHSVLKKIKKIDKEN